MVSYDICLFLSDFYLVADVKAAGFCLCSPQSVLKAAASDQFDGSLITSHLFSNPLKPPLSLEESRRPVVT